MTQTAAKPQHEIEPARIPRQFPLDELREEKEHREWQASMLRLLWNRRRLFAQVALAGLLASTVLAFSIPKSYTSTAQLMPPDTQSPSGMAMIAALSAKAGSLGSLAGDLFGLNSSGALFVGVLRSQTAQERLVQEFGLQKVYGRKFLADARTTLDEHTAISEDHKSGIISISVTDHDPDRAAGLANGYVKQLNSLVTELSTSSAHRERVFLEDRLKVAKQDLDDASNQLAQFSSKHNTLDIQTEGKAMLDAAGTLAGQMIAAQSELEGLRQIYTDNNPRVRALNARVAELRKQLDKLGGAGAEAKSDPESVSQPTNGMPYPTIRSLPLLGAKYADYYRRAKIQETVFELLTEQYELAKVEEAKETPSVKVLDPALKPERKSFPPRLLVMFLGTFLALSVCVVGVVGADHWKNADPEDPRKILAEEVFATLKAQTQRFSRNGNAPGADTKKQKDADSRRLDHFSVSEDRPENRKD